MIRFWPIAPRDLTETDMRTLVKVGQRSYDGTSAEKFIDLALAGTIQFWRVTGMEDGLIGTGLIKKKDETLELWLYFMAGKGMFAKIEEVWEELKSLARHSGATSIGTVAGAGTQRVYERRLKVRPIEATYSVGIVK